MLCVMRARNKILKMAVSASARRIFREKARPAAAAILPQNLAAGVYFIVYGE